MKRFQLAANKSSISKTSNYEKMGEFWDAHDFTEFDDLNAPDVEFHISVAIPVKPTLLAAIEELAASAASAQKYWSIFG